MRSCSSEKSFCLLTTPIFYRSDSVQWSGQVWPYLRAAANNFSLQVKVKINWSVDEDDDDYITSASRELQILRQLLFYFCTFDIRFFDWAHPVGPSHQCQSVSSTDKLQKTEIEISSEMVEVIVSCSVLLPLIIIPNLSTIVHWC